MRAEDDASPWAGLELGERPSHEGRAGSPGDVLPEDLHAAVLGVAEQHLVTRREPQRADDHVQRRADVRREDEIAGRRADVGGELEPRRFEQRREAAPERQELHWLALELQLEALVGLEHRAGAGAERPVVQVDDRRIEEEKILHSP